MYLWLTFYKRGWKFLSRLLYLEFYSVVSDKINEQNYTDFWQSSKQIYGLMFLNFLFRSNIHAPKFLKFCHVYFPSLFI